MDLFLNIGFFILGFYIIIKAADFFIDEAATIGKSFGMSKLMIGLTIVAVGTSLPELITSLGAIFFTSNYADFIVGTLMGSNITNILLAFGLFLIIAKKFQTTKRELFNVISLLFTSIFLIVFILLGYVNYIVLILIPFYIFYIFYLKKYQKKEYVELEDEVVHIQRHSLPKSITIFILSFAGLFLGAKTVIYSIENLGMILAIPTAYLTLTTISIATSLPEIAVTISSARKKEYLLGIGNILGTNVMNICLILGFSGLFGKYVFDVNLYLFSAIILLIGTIMFSIMIISRKFNHYYGYFLLILYIAYITQFLI